jgi:hypothetical protein
MYVCIFMYIRKTCTYTSTYMVLSLSANDLMTPCTAVSVFAVVRGFVSTVKVTKTYQRWSVEIISETSIGYLQNTSPALLRRGTNSDKFKVDGAQRCSPHLKVYMSLKSKGKGKSIPLQSWTGPEGSRRLRLPEFLDNQHMKVVRLSTVRTGRLYPPGSVPGTHFC